MELVIRCVTQKYGTFSGRARRKEFWLYSLTVLVLSVILVIIDVTAGTYDPASGYGVLSSIFYLAVLIPSIAVGVRRLHDTNRRGWWYLLILIPILGSIAMIIFWCLKGTVGENRFGSDPVA